MSHIPIKQCRDIELESLLFNGNMPAWLMSAGRPVSVVQYLVRDLNKRIFVVL